MYLARKEMQKLAAEQAAKASQAEQGRDDSEEEGTSTEEEGGDLFPISPVHNKSTTPFSGQGQNFLAVCPLANLVAFLQETHSERSS